MKDALDIVGAFSTPILLVVCWLVWRIYSNHLPHIEESLREITERLARVEGRQEEEIDARLARRR